MGLAVGVALGVGVAVVVDEALGVGDPLAVPLALEPRVALDDGDAVPVPDRDGELVALCDPDEDGDLVALSVALGDMLVDADAVSLPVEHAVGDTDREIVAVGEPLAVAVEVAFAVTDGAEDADLHDALGVAEGVHDRDAAAVAVRDPVPVCVAHIDAVGETVPKNEYVLTGV